MVAWIRGCMAGALLLLLASAAAAQSSYRIAFNGVDYASSAQPVHGAVSYPIYGGNSTNDFQGQGAAGPGTISAVCRVSTQWDGGLSGGSHGQVNVGTDTDGVLTGPPGNVTGTMHLWLTAAFDRQGGFAGNNAVLMAMGAVVLSRVDVTVAPERALASFPAAVAIPVVSTAFAGLWHP